MSKHSALDTFGRSGNPAFGDIFEGDAQFTDLPTDQKMTLTGTCLLYTSPSPRDRG